MPEHEDFEAFRRRVPEGTFSQWLKACAGEAWETATTHRFTQEIGSGTVSEQAYTRYLIEDYHYVVELASALGFLVGKAPTMPSKRELAGFLQALTSEENDYFLRCFEALNVPLEDVMQSKPLEPIQVLGGYLLKSAREGAYIDGMVTLLASEWIYEAWGVREAQKRAPDSFFLEEWVRLHSSPEFLQFVAWLRDETDRHGAGLSADKQQQLADSFKRMCELETAFFESVYVGAPTKA